MTITEVSNKYGLTHDTLRYYERIGLMPAVNRNKSGIRDYSEEDCRWIEFIKCMRGAGLSVEVLMKYFELFLKGEETIDERKQLLIEQREQLVSRIAEMQDTLKRLNHKIDMYDQKILPMENSLKHCEP